MSAPDEVVELEQVVDLAGAGVERELRVAGLLGQHEQLLDPVEVPLGRVGPPGRELTVDQDVGERRRVVQPARHRHGLGHERVAALGGPEPVVEGGGDAGQQAGAQRAVRRARCARAPPRAATTATSSGTPGERLKTWMPSAAWASSSGRLTERAASAAASSVSRADGSPARVRAIPSASSSSAWRGEVERKLLADVERQLEQLRRPLVGEHPHRLVSGSVAYSKRALGLPAGGCLGEVVRELGEVLGVVSVHLLQGLRRLPVQADALGRRELRVERVADQPMGEAEPPDRAGRLDDETGRPRLVEQRDQRLADRSGPRRSSVARRKWRPITAAAFSISIPSGPSGSKRR